MSSVLLLTHSLLDHFLNLLPHGGKVETEVMSLK